MCLILRLFSICNGGRQSTVGSLSQGDDEPLEVFLEPQQLLILLAQLLIVKSDYQGKEGEKNEHNGLGFSPIKYEKRGRDLCMHSLESRAL